MDRWIVRTQSSEPPDLDLEVLLPDETSTAPTYANADQWLHLVEDEDDRDDIKAWVTRVRDGKRDGHGLIHGQGCCVVAVGGAHLVTTVCLD